MLNSGAYISAIVLLWPAAAWSAESLPDRVGVLLGRLHQAVAHFPVALLIVAGLIELFAATFHTDRGRRASRVCLCLGAAGAVVAAGMGWLNASFDRTGPDSLTLSLHRWGGIGLAGVAVLAALLAVSAKGKVVSGLARLTTIGVAATVAAVGHWGGSLVHGEGYVLAAFAPSKPALATPMPIAAVEATATDEREVTRPIAGLPAAAERILNDSSDQGVFLLRRAIRLASLPSTPPVPTTSTPAFNEIDQFIASRWRDAKLPEADDAPPVCDDSTFVRRVYLDLIGAVPTLEELQRFESDTRADKRVRLVEELLARDGDYADHWTPFWEDALGSSYANLQGGVPTRGNYRQWINESFKANKAFDLFAAELIDTRMPGAKKPERANANGRESKIAYIRNETHTDTLQSAAAVAQVFLGTGMKCASCHNHFENDEWPQKRVLAYTGLFAASDLELIRCEQNTGEVVAAAFCFDIPGAPRDVPSDEAGRLHRAAQLITDPMNPRFAKAIVNRLWKRYLGLGLFEPVDDFRLDLPASHPELLEWLAHDLAVHDFDLKRTIRLILTSRTYQLRYNPAVEDHFDVAKKADPRYFRSPSLRRQTAEQIVDSIRVAAEQRLDSRTRLFHVNESTALSRALGKPASRNEISTNRADDAAVVQALELLNGEEFGGLIASAELLESSAAVEARITSIYRAVLSRSPSKEELASASEYLSSAAARVGSPSDPVTTLLLDDETPEYARLGGQWTWSEDPTAVHGKRSRVQKAEPGKPIQHFAADLHPLRVRGRDTLFIHVYLDPADPPEQIMVQWNDGVVMNDGGWSHRAYWGENKIAFGRSGTASRRRMGDLPELGKWVRLEVPAHRVGFGGAGGNLVGLAFDQFGGTVRWDAAGIVSRPEDATAAALADLMWALLVSPEFQYIR